MIFQIIYSVFILSVWISFGVFFFRSRVLGRRPSFRRRKTRHDTTELDLAHKRRGWFIHYYLVEQIDYDKCRVVCWIEVVNKLRRKKGFRLGPYTTRTAATTVWEQIKGKS